MGKLTKYTLQIVVLSLVVWLLTVMVFTEELVFTKKEDTTAEVVVPEGAEFQDGTFTATVDGHNGPLTLDLVVEAGNIADLQIVEHTESDGISDPAFEQVPAAIIEANSTAVETVSGATVTSNAIISAANAALAESAGGEVAPAAPVEESAEEEVEESTEEESEEVVEEESTEEAVALEDGTFTAEVDGHNGPLEVEVTVEDAAISAVEILSHEETEGISDPAIEEIPAAIVEANSTDVETISGATVTSEAIIEAVNQALSQDDAEAEDVVYQDGTYTAEAEGRNGPVEVEVTIEDGVIAKVEILSHEETEEISDPAIEEVPAAIVEANSANVETVSGATLTSEAIIEAVKLALEDAQ